MILNDKGVKNQWCGIVRVVDSVLDKKAMRAGLQNRTLEGDQIEYLNRRVLGSHLKWDGGSVIDAILSRGIYYSGVRIEGECCYPCYLDTCTVLKLLKEIFEATSGAHRRNQKSTKHLALTSACP